MGGSSNDQGSQRGSSSTRPTPTIEGTAEEVLVETEEPDGGTPDASDTDGTDTDATGASGDAGSDDPSSEEDESEKRAPDDDESGEEIHDDPQDEDQHEQAENVERDAGEPASQQAPRRSFAGVLLAALFSLLTHAFAGILGGLAVLLVLSSGYLPSGALKIDGFDDLLGTKALKDRIAKLEAAPVTPDNTAPMEALKSRLASLESKTSAPSGAGDVPGEVKALSDKVRQLETSLSAMADAAKDGGSPASAAAIAQQVGALEKRLDEKIALALKSEKATEASDTKAIETLKSEIATVDAKLKALAEAELAAKEVAQLAPEVVAIDERLARIERTLPALANAVDEDSAETRKATLAIAYASLREAVNAGRPYGAELSTLAALSPGAGGLGSLVDYEDKGIPTVRALRTSFGALRDKALATEAAHADTLMGRLLGSAQSLVQVRRIDESAEGTSASAVLARAAGKLKKGDLKAATGEVASLKGPVGGVFENWLDDARARLDAQVTLARLRDILLISLAGNAPEESAGDGKPQDEKSQADKGRDGKAEQE